MTERILQLLKELTLEEKASLCSGKDFWNTKAVQRLGIPSIMMSDGPHGLRKENNEDDAVGLKQSFPATSFPPAVNLASTWNPQMARLMGEMLGEECQDQEVNIILGPGTNIKRSPLCGRNFEYLSEDPHLAGVMCREYIDGVQSKGVGTSLKHFCANSQERLRMTINAILDERTLREIYLPAFETAVQAQPATVMCSYNRLNGTYLSDNRRMLTEILRDEWGYRGVVVSDWNATNDRVEGVRSGMDLEMPSTGGATDKQIVKAVKDGTLDEADLDKIVARLIEMALRYDALRRPDYRCDYQAAHDAARRIAEESMVLLKNDRNLLPFAADGERFAVIGDLAKHPRYQGAGSSHINPYQLVGFTDCLDALGVDYEFAPAYNATGNDHDETMIAQAIETAKRNKRVLLFVGLTDDFESESYDRSHMNLPASHDKLVREVLQANPDTVVILFGGSPVAMPWIDDAHTLLNAYLPGEAGGEALYNILFGKVNPSGKLAETYPIRVEDYLASRYYPMGPKNVEYRESIFVGYRYYDSARKQVCFPFGYGLSYTRFEYSDLRVDGMQVSYTVTNVGDRRGAEAAQLYVHDCAPLVYKAEQELKAFAKVTLQPGESARVVHTLQERDFAFYNTAVNGWTANDGVYEIRIGASSRDIRLRQAVELSFASHTDNVPDYRSICPCYYDMPNLESVPDEQYHALYGAPIPPNVPSKRGSFDRNTTIGELRCCLIGKIIMAVAPSIIKGQVPNADMTTMLMLQQGMSEMPMRALGGVTSGLLSQTLIDGFLLWGNRHRLRGLFRMLRGLGESLRNIARKDEANRQKHELARQRKELEKQQKAEEKQAAKEQKAEEKEAAKAQKAEEKEAAKAQKAEEKEAVKAEKAAAKAARKSDKDAD